MKFVKKKTSEKVITTRTYVVELTENEYNWLISHPNFESYNYGSIWYDINATPYVRTQENGCNYKNTVEGLDIYRNLNAAGSSYSNTTLSVDANATINNSTFFTVKKN
jgi:hypothetical protein